MRVPWRPADVRVPQRPAAGAELSGDDARPRGLRELDELDAVFGALAHSTRRHLLQVLHARAGAMTAGQLASRFAHYSWPTITRHLGVLTRAGLVAVRQEGRERHYVLDRERLARALDLWLPSVGLTARGQAPAAER